MLYDETMSDPEKAPAPNFDGALRTQRAILNTSFLWGLPLSSDCHDIPESPHDMSSSEGEGDRMIHVDLQEDGEWRVEWDA